MSEYIQETRQRVHGVNIRIREAFAANAFSAAICFVFFDESFGIIPWQPHHAYLRVIFVIWCFVILSFLLRSWRLFLVVAAFPVLFFGFSLGLGLLESHLFQDEYFRAASIKSAYTILLLTPVVSATLLSIRVCNQHRFTTFSVSFLLAITCSIALSSSMAILVGRTFNDSTSVFMLVLSVLQTLILIVAVLFTERGKLEKDTPEKE